MDKTELFNKIEAILKRMGIWYEINMHDENFNSDFYKSFNVYGKLPHVAPEDDWEDDWGKKITKAEISIHGDNVWFWEHISGSFENGRLSGRDRWPVEISTIDEETTEEWVQSLLCVAEVT